MEQEKIIKNAEKMSVTELEQYITNLSEIYYNTGKSNVPDKIYDLLLEILEKKDKNSKILSQVGARTKQSVKLPFYASSLNKIKSDTDELDKWQSNYQGPYVMSDKLDGVSCVIVKKDCGLKLYTRGDGYYGSDITHLKKYVLSSDVKIDLIPINTVIRGELIISKNNFFQIETIMENARNAVSGLVNAKKIKKNIAKLTEFIAYNIIYPKMFQQEQLITLTNYNFKVVQYQIYQHITNNKLSDYLVKRRKESEYEIDGIVVTDNSELYDITETNPKYAFAFKSVITSQTAEVTVTSVNWNLSKDGYFKPQIKISPVRLSGVTISSLTGFNAKYICDNKIGPGSILEIVRSGDVIPHIIKIIESSYNNQPQMPEENYEWSQTGVDLIKIDQQNNNEIITKKLVYFFQTLNIKNINEKIIEKMVKNNINSVKKIIQVSETELINIDGFGEKLIKKIRTNIIDGLLNTNLTLLMTASQCFGRGIGIKKIKLILTEYPNILKIKEKYNEKYNEKCNEKLINKILKINGFDILTATQFVKNIDNFVSFFDDLNTVINLNYLLNNKKNTINISNLFKDQIIVFTGVRDLELENLINQNMGKVTTSISNNTTMVIYSNTIKTLTQKLKDASAKQIPILTLDEFKTKYNLH